MTNPEPYGDHEWSERLRRAVEQTLEQRQARRRQREQLQAARAVGLERRHRDRIAAADERLRQAQHDGPADSWWED